MSSELSLTCCCGSTLSVGQMYDHIFKAFREEHSECLQAWKTAMLAESKAREVVNVPLYTYPPYIQNPTYPVQPTTITWTTNNPPPDDGGMQTHTC